MSGHERVCEKFHGVVVYDVSDAHECVEIDYGVFRPGLTVFRGFSGHVRASGPNVCVPGQGRDVRRYGDDR